MVYPHREDMLTVKILGDYIYLVISYKHTVEVPFIKSLMGGFI